MGRRKNVEGNFRVPFHIFFEVAPFLQWFLFYSGSRLVFAPFPFCWASDHRERFS